MAPVEKHGAATTMVVDAKGGAADTHGLDEGVGRGAPMAEATNGRQPWQTRR